MTVCLSRGKVSSENVLGPQRPAHRGLLVLGGALVLVLVLDRSARAQNFCNPTSSETQEPALLVAESAPFAVGFSDTFEGGVTDLTFRDEGGVSQVLATDPVVAANVSSFSPDLLTKGGLISPDVVGDVFGIASIPGGPLEDASYILDPGWLFTNTWDPQIGGFLPTVVAAPRIGVINESGSRVEPFQDIVGLPLDGGGLPDLILTAMDVHPDGTEIAIVASAENFGRTDQFFLVLDAADFSLIRGPFPVKGAPALNFRSGICYNTCDTVLILGTFRNNFESHLALEYDRMTGEYTGRAISLDEIASPGGAVSAVGLDVGFLDGSEVLYTYNAETDALYAVALQYSLFPGVVTDLFCAREAPRRTGSATLQWTNDPLADYDEIVILQNGVQIDSLAPDESVYLPPDFKTTGSNEFAVEIRKNGLPNALRAYCTDQDSPQPAYTTSFADPFDAVVFLVPFRDPPQPLDGPDDPYNPGFVPMLLGMDSTQLVDDLSKFRLYILMTFTDSVLVFDIEVNRLTDEEISIQPGPVDRFTGVTLMDVGGETMLGLLGRNIQNKPGAAIYSRDGLLFQTIPEISLTGFEGDENSVLTDWDTDEDGHLIAADFRNGRLLEIEYDAEAGTMQAIASSPQPHCTIGPCDGSTMGGISVLPNGMYLVSGATALDDLVTRAFLTTPFETGVNDSVALIGYTMGLLPLNLLRPERLFGVGAGPARSLGLTATHFEYEMDGNTVVEDATHYSSQGMPIQLLPPSSPIEMIDSPLIHTNGGAADPDFAGEQLFDGVIEGVGSTGALRPSFADLSPELDYFYLVVNRGDAAVGVQVEIALDGLVESDFTEILEIPAGRYVNRSLIGRVEPTIDVRLVGTGALDSQIQVVVGARGKPEGDVEPMDTFRRGDVDGNGILDVTDPIVNLTYQFIGGIELVCPDAADVDDSGALDISDPIANLTFQFIAGGAPPPSPGHLSCGVDPTPDANNVDLGCPAYPRASCE